MSVQEDFRTGMNETGEDEETRESLSLIAEAVNLSLIKTMKNESEMLFQMHGRLIGWVGSNRVIEEYLKRMESDVAKPRVLCVNEALIGTGGRSTKIIPIEVHKVLCMSLFPDDERVACGCWDGRVVVLNIRLGEIEREWQTYEDETVEDETDEDETDRVFNPVLSLAVLQNGTQIITRPEYQLESSCLDVWNVESGQRVMTIGSPNYDVECFAITHDESWVVCVSKEGALQTWKLSDGGIVDPGINVGDGVKDIELLKDQERAIIGYIPEGKLRIWNIRTGAQLGQFVFNSVGLRCFTMTPDERSVVICSWLGKVILWDLESHQQVWTSTLTCAGKQVAVSTDGSRIIIGDDNGAIQILDAKSGSLVCEPLRGHANKIIGISFLRSKDSIVSCSRDDTIRMWDIARGQNKNLINRHEAQITRVLFTPDGKFVVTASCDNTLRIWDTTTGEGLGDPLHGYSWCVNDMAVTPNGRFVVSVSVDETVIVWDLESRKLLHTFNGHTWSVNCVAVTPKGDRAVTGSRDKTVRIWDLEQMDGTHTVFEEHNNDVMRVFVSDDGLRVVSVDFEDNIFVWDMETKEVLKTAVVEDAWMRSRIELFGLIGERTDQDETGLSIRHRSKQIMHGKGSEARVLATLESSIDSWDISPDKKTLCLGLCDRQVALLKIDL